jgi:hypothetical protein
MKYAVVLVVSLAAAFAVQAAHPSPPSDVPQLMTVIAYADGRPAAAAAAGFAPSLSTCQTALAGVVADMTPKPGVYLLGVCYPLPPVPNAARVNDTTS